MRLKFHLYLKRISNKLDSFQIYLLQYASAITHKARGGIMNFHSRDKAHILGGTPRQ